MKPRSRFRYLLLFPDRIEETLSAVAQRPEVNEVPNLWQIGLGVIRMNHRLLFRSDTVGTSTTDPVRSGWRARALSPRPIRFPFLVAQRAVAPFDLSGLASGRDRIIQHLLYAHHDQNQFVYDLELLSIYPGAIREVAERARDIADGSDSDAEWAKDLVVFADYHHRLHAAAEDAARRLEDGTSPVDRISEPDPDISFFDYLAWCAAQPKTAGGTVALWLDGRFGIAEGLRARG